MLGPKTGYVDMFLYQLEEAIKKDHGNHYQRFPLRPSSSGKCPRELYFETREFLGKEKYTTKPMEPETHLLLNLGHSIERHLIEQMRKHFSVAEIKYTQQTVDFGEYLMVDDEKLRQHLEGSLDLCLWNAKWKCAVDIKSKGDSYNFKSRKMKWEEDTQKLATMTTVKALSNKAFYVDNLDDFLTELKDPFFAANFLQLNMYLNSPFLQERGVDHGAIIQYHKSKSKLREVRFRPSRTAFMAVIEKFKSVGAAAIKGDPSDLEAPYQPSDFKARYCSFCQAKVPGSCAMINKKEEKE